MSGLQELDQLQQAGRATCYGQSCRYDETIKTSGMHFLLPVFFLLRKCISVCFLLPVIYCYVLLWLCAHEGIANLSFCGML